MTLYAKLRGNSWYNFMFNIKKAQLYVGYKISEQFHKEHLFL